MGARVSGRGEEEALVAVLAAPAQVNGGAGAERGGAEAGPLDLQELPREGRRRVGKGQGAARRDS